MSYFKEKFNLKIMKKNLLPISILIVAILLAGVAIFVSLHKCSFSHNLKVMDSKEVSQKVINYLNNDMFGGRVKVDFIGVSREDNLYKITVKIQGKKYDLYATLNGKYFYPERINLEKSSTQANKRNSNGKKSCADIKKSDKPLMQAFVVSHCPFGLQMQRILVEIWKKDPSLMNNVKERYIGLVSNGKISSMHGTEEAQENLKQICIREEQSSKYWPYISCYIKDGNGDKCLKETNIDENKLNSCEKDLSRGLKYAKEDFALGEKYQISGSPTLILNGEKVSEFDFGGRTAEAVKELLCCGFKNEPKVCSTKLNAATAAPSFSEKYSGNGSQNGGGCQ